MYLHSDLELRSMYEQQSSLPHLINFLALLVYELSCYHTYKVQLAVRTYSLMMYCRQDWLVHAGQWQNNGIFFKRELARKPTYFMEPLHFEGTDDALMAA